ncbi:MAG: DUF3135 domain-containing protein [Nitrococcus sp.]|nr:DUF3135 domain-containing protein [Nitrococcus sp.]
MDGKQRFTIDFDDWSNLARRDSAGFEARRHAMLDSFIKAQPAERRERLRCLQWRVDRVREHSSTPLLACQRLYQLMWDTFAGPAGLTQALAGALPQVRKAPHPLRRSAKILPFRRPDII